VAGDTLDLGVVEAVDHDLIVGAEPSIICADRAGRPSFGAAENPPSEEHDDQKDSCADNNSDPLHDHSPSWGERAPDRAVLDARTPQQDFLVSTEKMRILSVNLERSSAIFAFSF